MLLTESQIRQIIKEEIEAMVQEGELDEGFFGDAIGGLKKGVGRIAGRMASAAGATSADLQDMEQARAAAKSKEQEAGVAEIKKKGSTRSC